MTVLAAWPSGALGDRATTSGSDVQKRSAAPEELAGAEQGAEQPRIDGQRDGVPSSPAGVSTQRLWR